jgi:hypothetical protein
MNPPAAWRTDDRRPCCGTRLHVTDTPATVTFTCPACFWNLTADFAGALRSVRIDGARRIKASDLAAFVASLEEDAA